MCQGSSTSWWVCLPPENSMNSVRGKKKSPPHTLLWFCCQLRENARLVLCAMCVTCSLLSPAWSHRCPPSPCSVLWEGRHKLAGWGAFPYDPKARFCHLSWRWRAVTRACVGAVVQSTCLKGSWGEVHNWCWSMHWFWYLLVIIQVLSPQILKFSAFSLGREGSCWPKAFYLFLSPCPVGV